MSFNDLIGQQHWKNGQSQTGPENRGLGVVVGLGIDHFKLMLCGGSLYFYLVPTIWV
jgi:hypothetical protein